MSPNVSLLVFRPTLRPYCSACAH